ncbi:alpha/beta fold hydrolase [Cyanobacteria bacterium FACHB-63]|nr:alpha/beta fold hydrolase [Cyanobacteria bacterium FACHB-63]
MLLTQTQIDQYVQVGTVKTRYWEAGAGKQTLILLHGAGGSVEFWYYNFLALARKHRVIAIDMVGSGRSDKPSASYSLRYQAEFVQGFMNALSIHSAVLVGHSMSGGAVLQLALMAPERIEKLVLVGSFGLGREVAISARLATLPMAIRSLQPTPAVMRPMLRQNVFDVDTIPQEWIDLRYPIFALPGRKEPLIQMARTNLNLLGVQESVYQSIVQNLASITAPALIIWGKQDRIIPLAHAHVAAKNLPNAKQPLLIDRCGHYPHLEHPAQFNQVVLNFVQDC